jgi:YD repeat-containing protein
MTEITQTRWVSGGTIDITSYGYNASGYLQTITDAIGNVTTVTSWDWRGAPLSFTDPNGVATNLTYDIHGRLLTATINPGASQSLYPNAGTGATFPVRSSRVMFRHGTHRRPRHFSPRHRAR